MRVGRWLLPAVLAAAPLPLEARDPVFDPSVLHETRITMDPADWQALRDNYRLNDYYAADVTFDGVALAQVGVRSRGDGSRSPVKPALKVDFNRFVKGQTLRGLKSVSLKNLVQDPAMLRERLAMAVFEAMGLAAPAVSFTRVFVNGEYQGVYNVIESIDKDFLESRLGEDGGNLFSYEWTTAAYDFGWRGDDVAAYVPVPFEPETNEDDTDTGSLVALIRAINHAPDETFAAEMRSWLDVERFVTHLAVEAVVQESDGIVGRQGMNNLYLYQYEGQRRYVFIAWDKNTTLHSPDSSILERLETNVLTRRLLRDPALQRVYVEAARRAAELLGESLVLPMLDASYALIREAAHADANKPVSNDVFESGIVALRAVVEARRAAVLAEVEGLLR